eukprot:11214513-Lingulodinium_polyedra.AAC.1
MPPAKPATRAASSMPRVSCTTPGSCTRLCRWTRSGVLCRHERHGLQHVRQRAAWGLGARRA